MLRLLDKGHWLCAGRAYASDSAVAQQVLDEFITNYTQQYSAEYMGMAVLHGVNRLGEWADVTGSVAGEGKDVITVRQTSQGYQSAEHIHSVPLESPEELELQVIQPLLEKVPEAAQALFTCLDQACLLMVEADRSDATYLAGGVFSPLIWRS